MREEPDIVKELREAERLGLLQSKMKLAYEKPKQSYEQPKDILDEIASFVDNLQTSIQNADTTTLYSEKIYRDIVEQAIVGVVITWNNKILFCNKKEAELFGYTTPSELIGKEVSEFVHVNDLPRMQRLAEQLREGKTLSHPVIFRGIRNDGREIYIEAFATVFPFEGKKDSLLSFHLDVTERVKRENLIRNVENRYRLITENVNDLIATITFSLTPRYTYVSPSHERIMGYRAEELIGKPIFEFVHPDDRGKLLSLIKKYIAFKGKKSLTGERVDITETIEFRIMDVKGEWHYLETTLNIMGDELLFVSRDITKRKRVEEHFRDLFDNANDLIQSVDQNGRFVYVNKSWLKALGYTMEELESLTLFDVIREDYIQHCRELIKKVSEGKSFQGVETVFVAKDGREIFVEGNINGRFDEDGRFIATRAIFRDVTDRKKAEEQLKESELRLRTLLDATHDMVLLLDVDGRILYSNDAMAKSLGKNVEDIINSNIRDNLPSDVYESRVRMSIKVQRTGKPVKFVDTRGGRWFDNTFYPVFDEEGNVVQIAVFSRDITEERKVSEALKESEELFRTLVEFAPLGIYIYDPFDERFVYINPTLRRLAKAHGIKDVNLLDYLTPESLELIKKRVRERLEGKRVSSQVDVEAILPDGEKRLLRLHTTLTKYKGRKAMLAIVLDLTEEKRMQSMLEENETKYRSLMETAADGILIVDETLRIISGNKSAARIFGYSKKELSGKPLWEMMPKRLKNNFLKGIKKLNYMNISEFSKRTIEVVGLRKDGKEIPIELSFSMYEINGRRYFTSIIRDASERKKIEKELREREEKYRTIFETSPEVIVLFDRHGHIVDVNDRVRNWLGYTRKELIGKSIEKLPALSQESKKIAMKRFSQRFQKRKISSYDLEFITKNGAVVIGRVRGTVMENSDGRITGVLVMISDITKQKQFEEKLRESEEKFRTITSAAHDAILMMDNDGNISYWNKSAEKMFGYKAEEIIGKNLHTALAPPRFHEAHKKAFKKFRKTGKGAAVGKSLELSALRKDGTEFPVELSLSSVKIDGRWHAIGIVRDITERKRAEVELKEAYGKIETLLNAAADGIRIVDRDFKVTALNDTMAELAGVKKSEAVGMLCSDMFGSDDCGTKNCTMMRVLKSGKKIKSRTLRRRFDGKMVPCLHVATPLKDEKGDIVGIIDDFRDITELERVEINLAKAHYKLRQQNEKLKRLNNLQKIFLNVTSHELRTPMAAIKGYTDLLTMGTLGDLTDEQKEAISVMRRNIDRLDNLIKDILDISRLESGTLSIQPTKCDLLEIITEVLATMRFTAETKNITIETNIDNNLPPIYADRDRIKQVLINLLGNAIKFSDSGSKIILSAKRDKNNVVIAVKDFGRGIPKNKQKKIFEPFYQVDSGMDRKFGGVGLGLAITRGIVEAHDGKITVESQVGKGSTFFVKLPLKPSFIKSEKRFSIFRDEKALPEISFRPSHSELEKLIDEMAGNTKK